MPAGHKETGKTNIGLIGAARTPKAAFTRKKFDPGTGLKRFSPLYYQTNT